MSKTKKIFLFILLLIMASGAYLFFGDLFQIKDMDSMDVYAKADMHNIAFAIQLAIGDGSGEPPDTMGELIDWLDVHAVHLQDIGVLRNNLLGDRWGTPFVLDYPEPHKFVITSCGKNRQYDYGKIDDVVYSFDPLEGLE